MDRTCSMHGGKVEYLTGFWWERRRKGPLGRSRRRWGNIKTDLRETGWGGMDWINLAQDKGSCEHGNEPSGP
jgi:hypothetical protein